VTSSTLVFLGVLSIFLGVVLVLGIRILPREEWQVLAAIPRVKEKDGTWSGLNLTYYGLFTANAYVLALAVFLILLAAIGVPVTVSILFAVLVLSACMPLSRVIARIVEGKSYTFTVGGASFAGLVAAPWVLLAVNAGARAFEGPGIPVAPAVSAMAVAYAFGEGLGRLACLSFGCCYGRALEEMPPVIRRMLAGKGCVFSGKTKKAAYESGLEGVELVPVQAMTAILYSATGLVSTGLFLLGWYRWAFLFAVLVTQGWRAWSESLRADFRGGGKITAYQAMALVAMGYSVFIFFLLSDVQRMQADLVAGVGAVWNLPTVLFLQGLWVLSFHYTGRSMVTGSRITIHVHRERI